MHACMYAGLICGYLCCNTHVYIYTQTHKYVFITHMFAPMYVCTYVYIVYKCKFCGSSHVYDDPTQVMKLAGTQNSEELTLQRLWEALQVPAHAVITTQTSAGKLTQTPAATQTQTSVAAGV